MKKSLIIILLLVQASFAQKTAEKLKFPENPKISKKFKNSIEEQIKEFNRLFSKDSVEIKKYSVEFMLEKIENDKEYKYIFIAEYWIAFNYKEMIPELINRLTNKKEIGLINSADLIIHERIQSGDLKSYGHGGVSVDDLFTVAGRANRLLTEITGESFGHVSMYSTEKELTELQNHWTVWLNKL
jgi:hypothetical protein